MDLLKVKTKFDQGVSTLGMQEPLEINPSMSKAFFELFKICYKLNKNPTF